MDVSKYRDLLDEIRRISEEPPKTEIERMTKDLQCYILFRAVAVYECTLKTEDYNEISILEEELKELFVAIVHIRLAYGLVSVFLSDIRKLLI